MAVKKRRTKTGAASAAPTPSNGGGIKKRTSIPVEPDVPEFPGELGNVVEKITASGKYGTPFLKASSRKMQRGYSRTGVLALDLALGGGWRKSSTGMVYGEKSAGKSTLALQSIATLQKNDPDALAGWVDVEGTFDQRWAQKLGVDLDRVAIAEPSTGEDAVDLADALLRARNVQMVVTDSIAMLVPMREIDDSASQETMGVQARLVGKYIRKTTNAILRARQMGNDPVLIHLNQFRMKLGMVFGDPRTLPGGKALEFSTTQQVEAKNKEHVGKDADKNDVVLFNEHNFKITKNKGGGPMREGVFKLNRTKGNDDLPEAFINQAKAIYAFGSQAGIITGAPSSFEIEGIRGKFRGAPALNAWALENPLPYDQVQAQIIEYFRKKWEL